MDTKKYEAARSLRRLMSLSLAVIGAVLLSSATASADVARSTMLPDVHSSARIALTGEKD